MPKSTESIALNRSLSLRLLLFAGAMIGFALIAAWVVLGILFERHSERQLQAELERHGIALIAAVEPDANGRPVLIRKLTDPRFERPGSGLYWRVKAPSGDLRSRSLWDGNIPLPGQSSTQGWTMFKTKGPFEENVIAIARTVRMTSTSAPITVEVAADRIPVAKARADFATETGFFLLLLWLALAAAAWIQVRLGLRPLKAISDELTAMSASIDARLSPAAHPVEIQPLTSAINEFADRRANDVAHARERAKDLAHALKTPITALRMQIEQLDEKHRWEMSHSLSLLAGAVESELARNQGVESGRSVSAAQVVDRLLSVVSRTPDGAALAFRNLLPLDLTIPMSEEAALEAFGALIDNAARHARTTVEISGISDARGRRLRITDDGDGIAEALRPAALGRGVRLDERGSRHGLGLSIAQRFVEASGGQMELETADLGGLCVLIEWAQ